MLSMQNAAIARAAALFFPEETVQGMGMKHILQGRPYRYRQTCCLARVVYCNVHIVVSFLNPHNRGK
jgi:hypothetical protein